MSLRSHCLAVVSLCASGLIAGCSIGSLRVVDSPASQTAVGTITGTVYGGQQPIIGAHVYLFAAGTTGYGGASTSLITNVSGTTMDSSGNYYVTTGANGSFALGGTYTCTSGTQVYLYAIGGNPGAGTNSSAGLMATLGQCPAAGNLAAQCPFLNVTEVSTVATAFALAGYAVDPRHIAHSGTALAQTGIANAAANVANMVNVATGQARATTPGGGTVPQSRINSIANALAACINTTGPTSSQCSTLFSKATLDGTSTGAQPTDTAAAAINIAHYPYANVSAIFGLQQSIGAPYNPALSATPNDLTLALTFTGGGLGVNPHLAVDGLGNVWATPDNSALISKFSPLGVALSSGTGITGTGLAASKDIAIDINNNAIALGTFSTTVLGVTSNYSTITNIPVGTLTGTTSGGFGAYPLVVSLAIDSSGYNYFVDSSSSAIVGYNILAGIGFLTSSHAGQGLTPGVNYTALDGAGGVWATSGNNVLSKFTIATASTAGTGFSGGGLNSPRGIAFDAGGNVWTANFGNNSLSSFSSAGVAASPTTGYTGGGLSAPVAIAADGLAHVWALNSTGNSLSEFSAAGVALTGTTGLTNAALNSPKSMVIDGSGNIWVGNANSATLTEFIGVAGPVVTPLSVAVANSKLGVRP